MKRSLDTSRVFWRTVKISEKQKSQRKALKTVEPLKLKDWKFVKKLKMKKRKKWRMEIMKNRENPLKLERWRSVKTQNLKNSGNVKTPKTEKSGNWKSVDIRKLNVWETQWGNVKSEKCESVELLSRSGSSSTKLYKADFNAFPSAEFCLRKLYLTKL
jgi:hypothetical protein